MAMGIDAGRALINFHPFSRYDFISAFTGKQNSWKGNTTFYRTDFLQHGQPQELLQSLFLKLQKFTCSL